jgi:hypothetical protein
MKYLILIAACLGTQILQAQVSLQTGSSEFNMPIFNWQDNSSRLSVAVGVTYNSGNGLNVDDVPGPVGQNFNLLAGGVITRLQSGLPDDQKGTGLPNGHLYNRANIAKGCPQSLSKYPIYKNTTVYKNPAILENDREMDYFAFSFNGRGGLFILGKNGKCELLSNSNLKVTYYEDQTLYTRTKIKHFIIKDEQGVEYKFATASYTNALKSRPATLNADGMLIPSAPSKYENGNVYHQGSFETGSDGTSPGPDIINSWYLSEIRDPFTNRSIFFTYDTWFVDDYGSKNIAVTRTTLGQTETVNSNFLQYSYVVINHQRTKMQMLAINSIFMPNGEYEVKFNYNPAYRTDLKGTRSLDRIVIKSKDRILNQYKFDYQYLGKELILGPNHVMNKRSRLFLKSIQKMGGTGSLKEPPYQFQYYEGTGIGDDVIPPLFSDCKDVWGYYNGTNNGFNVDQNLTSYTDFGKACFVNGPLFFAAPVNNVIDYYAVMNPKNGYAKNGLLKAIIYPTGGNTQYEYEQNIPNATEINNATYGGVRVSKITVNGNIGNDNYSEPMEQRLVYTDANNSTTSSLWGAEKPHNFAFSKTYYQREGQKLGVTGCRYDFDSPGILEGDLLVSQFNWQQFINIVSQVYSFVNLARNIYLIASAASVSATTIPILNIAFFVFSYVINYIESCQTPPISGRLNLTFYNSNLIGANPLPTQYQRVEVLYGKSGVLNGGKTVYEFTSPSDYALIKPTITGIVTDEAVIYYPRVIPTRQLRVAPWAYGLPKRIVNYDASGKIVTETINQFSFIKTNLPAADFRACDCFVNKYSSQRNDTWAANTAFTTANTFDMKVALYTQFTGRTELIKSTERSYNMADITKYTEVISNFTYNTSNFLLAKTVVNNSKGETFTTTNTYPDATSTDLVVQAMIQNNQIANLLKRQVTIKKGTVETVLSNDQNEFTKLGNNDVKLQKNSGLETIEPIPIANTADVLAKTKPGSSITYNADGTVQYIKDEQGSRFKSFMYDYDKMYTTAEITNGVSTEVAYTSFETLAQGNWQFSQADALYTITIAATGRRSYVLDGSNTINSSFSVSKPYILSLRYKNAVAISANATELKKYAVPGPDGWTYAEYSVTAGVISLSGTGFVDELKLYPKEAAIMTYTYIPGYGKSSSCDKNGRITYYEYDDLGRLLFIRDEEKNILKMYEYNYKK